MIRDYTWSYNKATVPFDVKVEHVLKYGDLDEISEVITQAGLDYCRDIWERKIISDKRFERLDYFLARFVFNISTKRDEILLYLKSHQRKRFERFQ